jgi:competence protein ComEC
MMIAALSVIALLIWLAALQLPDGRMRLVFLDVGQGDAIFITSPEGTQVLVDGGPTPTRLAWELGRQMPFWDRSLDLVVLTHPDADHMMGLVPLFERYRVERAAVSPQTLSDDRTHHCREAAEKAGAAITVIERGSQILMGSTARLEVLHPSTEFPSGSESDNESSVVLRLVYGATSFLLSGDLQAGGEQALLASGQPLASQLLKVSHHGSGGATTGEFLTVVAPQLAVIQVGAGNRFGHPAPEVLDRLSVVGARVFRTDQHGTIEVISDGLRLEVRTAKHP